MSLMEKVQDGWENGNFPNFTKIRTSMFDSFTTSTICTWDSGTETPDFDFL